MPTPGAPGTGETDGAGDHFGQWSLRVSIGSPSDIMTISSRI